MRSHSPRSNRGKQRRVAAHQRHGHAERHETGRDRGGQQREQARVGEEQHDDDRDERRLADEVECAQPPESQRDADRDRVRLLNGGDQQVRPPQAGFRRPSSGRTRPRSRTPSPRGRRAPRRTRRIPITFASRRSRSLSVLGREFAGGDVRDTGFGEPRDDRDQRGDDHVPCRSPRRRDGASSTQPRRYRARHRRRRSQSAGCRRESPGRRRSASRGRSSGSSGGSSGTPPSSSIGESRAAHAERTSSSLVARLPSRL